MIIGLITCNRTPISPTAMGILRLRPEKRRRWEYSINYVGSYLDIYLLCNLREIIQAGGAGHISISRDRDLVVCQAYEWESVCQDIEWCPMLIYRFVFFTRALILILANFLLTIRDG